MKRTALIIAVILAALAAPVVAQDEEITLASLAEQLTALVSRVETIEEIFSGPDPIELEDGCQFAGDGQIQNTNLLKYKEVVRGICVG